MPSPSPHFDQQTLDILPAVSSRRPDTVSKAQRIIQAASILLPVIEQGYRLEAPVLRTAMREAFGADDNTGAWVWKDAYEASEAATVLFLRKHLPGMHQRAADPAALVAMLSALAELLPTHTRRSEESQTFQQFSTPLDLAFIAAHAAAILPSDTVLEPSAGTGLLAIHAAHAKARLALNELAGTRADLLAELFPAARVSRFNAEHIHDYLPIGLTPTIVLMNPPFSAGANIKGSTRGTDMKHISSALRRLAPGGRLVAITGHACAPDNPDYRLSFETIAQQARVVFSAPLAGGFFRKHGTSFETRLTVIDKIPAAEPIDPNVLHPQIQSAEQLLRLIRDCVPARAALSNSSVSNAQSDAPQFQLFAPKPAKAAATRSSQQRASEAAVELHYEPGQQTDIAPSTSDALYEPYEVQALHIPGAHPHPSKLVQSAAMASVRPPVPSYKPHLPPEVVTKGLLSAPQLESVIYAGEAHSQYLSGRWQVNETFDVLKPARDDDPEAVRYRRGWFLGDGTGAGKGRQVAGIILDNWLKGRRRAVWLSKSDKLLLDAQRDWSSLNRERLQVVGLDKFKQGKPIHIDEGILFATYSTLRSGQREDKASRLDQILEWLGKDFDGVIIFDESHAMANAAGTVSDRGASGPSQQGLAGLKLQHALPDARIVYVSATGASKVENLAYAQRLGFWGSDDFPFATRQEFVTAMHQGGLAAMEVLARDAKALGLYAARSLSYEGVEVDILEHGLTPEQIRIYDAYAEAFQVIHTNLNAALKAANITSESGTLNKQAKSAARSAFESNKQRFFNHLITAMKMPTMIAAIQSDIARGDAAIVQLVTTSEALMERRLALIPPAEWGDLSVDITPREYVLDYLAHGFPTQLFETYTDAEGNKHSRPAMHEGQPVQCREAILKRDAMIERLACLPPVQSALDQLLHSFGTDTVAEITGRSRRIVKKLHKGQHVFAVENRPSSSSIGDAQAFMDDRKQILVFSDAGGTGRSYHADLSAKNQRRRVHYLLEAGWKADAAIQGLGRSNRTNQKQPPLFRPVATDVRGEKRFLSTIARRLDTLGAITKGQRQTGGQGLFRAEDNLESPYARSALRTLYLKLYRGQIPECPLQRFHDVTGLSLTDQDGSLLETLPPIHTFLNRVLALQIDLQNTLFKYFEDILAGFIEGAIAAGTFEMGLETITADSLKIVKRQTIQKHAIGAETMLFEVERKNRPQPLTLENALEIVKSSTATRLMLNTKTQRAALNAPASSRTLEDGHVELYYRLYRPMETDYLSEGELRLSHWEDTDLETFSALWADELSKLPEFVTSRFHIVTGLLLPVWKRLPEDYCRIYRFRTDEGERVIGRPIPASGLAELGITPSFESPDDAYAHLMQGHAIELSEGLLLRKVMAMHAPRIELTGFHDTALGGLKALGLTSEMIAYRLRLFVPLIDSAPQILERIFKLYPPLAESESGGA